MFIPQFRSILRLSSSTLIVSLLFLFSLLTPPPAPVENSTIPAVAAAGRGNPWMNYSNGYFLDNRWSGDPKVVHAMPGAEARALAVGDFDEDGVPDLVSASATEHGGSVGLYRGNRDALFPNSAGAGQRRSVGLFVDTPFYPEVKLTPVGQSPDFLATGDFDADGHLDLALASYGEASIYMLPGKGNGSFAKPRTLTLPGTVTAFETGDVNWSDGLKDLVIGIQDQEQAKLLVFEGPGGALEHQPEVLDLSAPVSALTLGQFDDHPAIDIAVAAGTYLNLIHGPNRTPGGTASGIDAPSIQTWSLGTEIAHVAAGKFTGRNKELALISNSGDLSFFNLNTHELKSTPYSFPGSDVPRPLAVRASSRAGDDLLLVDRSGGQLLFFNRSHFEHLHDAVRTEAYEGSGLFIPQAPVAFGVPTGPVAVQPMRLNKDGLQDLAVLTADGGGVAVTLTAPVSTFVVNADGDDWDVSMGDGVCLTTLGNCTLIAAIQEANASAGPDEINFSIAEITDRYGQQVTETVTIDGTSQGHVALTRELVSLVFRENAASSSIRGLATVGSFSSILDADFLIIEDNYIGTNADGTESSGSGLISLTTDGNVVGGTVPEARNVMDGRIEVKGHDNIIQGNYVGVRADGTEALGDAFGPLITVAASPGNTPVENNLVGGPEPGAGNVVSSGSGINVGASSGTRVQGNYVGTDADGLAALGNFQSGINVSQSATLVRIGGTVDGAGNVVSGNPDYGIRVQGTEVRIQGNLIGMDATGRTVLGNEEAGILVSAGTDVLIGGDEFGAGNVISGNGEEGIFLSFAEHTRIFGNFIGTDISGTVAAGNGEQGIAVQSATDLIIGGVSPPTRNVIAGNGNQGILIRATADSVRMIANYIGTDRSGTVEIGNVGSGIEIISTGNQVGGTDLDEGNVIAFNGQDGVFVRSGEHNAVLGNYIYGNTELGIDLRRGGEQDPGVTGNDPGDSDDGPNLFQNYPELSVNADNSVYVAFSSMPSQDYRLEYFGNEACDESGFGEGRFFLGSDQITTDADGNHELDTSFAVEAGQEFITATATDADGNTSEFSNCIEVEPPPTLDVQVLQLDGNANPEPVPNTSFQIGRFNPDNNTDPFEVVTTQTTDADGLLRLATPPFIPGETFMLRTYPHTELAVKAGHGPVDGEMFNVEVDNLFIDYEAGSKRAVFVPDTLDPDINEVTQTFLAHTTYVFNLLVSIEWKAEDDYVERLEAAFRNASDYLYDVTNGQFRLGKVAIFDNRQHWEDADYRIYADNTLRAQVDEVNAINLLFQYARFTPREFGSEQGNRNGMFRETPLNPNTSDNYRTLIHEFGHYALGLYDEYKNQEGTTFNDGINFGFMDFHYQTGFLQGRAVMSSEMSLYVDSDYQRVEHFQETGQTSWQTVRDRFTRTYGLVEARILSPEEYGVPIADPFMLGPNEYNQAIDYPTGAMMEIASSNTPGSAPGKQYQVVHMYNGSLRHINNAQVSLEKRGSDGRIQLINHGKTSSRGEIRILGADLGDRISVSANIDGQYHSKLVSIETASTDIEEIIMGPVAEQPQVLSRVEQVDENSLSYVVQTDAGLNAPTLEVIEGDGTVTEYTLEESQDGFSATFDAPNGNRAHINLNTTDSQGEPYRINQDLALIDVDRGAGKVGRRHQSDHILSFEAGRNVTLFLDTTVTTAQQVMVLGSPFPPPEQGLPDSLRQVSQVYAISTFPGSSVLEGRIRMGYEADAELSAVEGGVQIYNWDGQWNALETSDDKLTNRVTADLVGTGYYAVFMDLTLTGTPIQEDVVPEAFQGVRLHANYPNPFQSTTVLSFDLDRSARIELKVYNVLGQEVSTLAQGTFPTGTHQVTFDARHLPPGLYVAQLRAGNVTVMRKMVVSGGSYR